MLAYEVVGHVVEQTGLLVAFGTLAPDVVKEHGEGTHAELVHAFELVDDVDGVLLDPLDVHAGVYGPDELYVVLTGTLHELVNLAGLLCGVGLTPAVAVPGVIFRTVDIDVHLLLSVEVELTQAVGVAPRVAVEAFDDASTLYAGVVCDFTLHDLRF